MGGTGGTPGSPTGGTGGTSSFGSLLSWVVGSGGTGGSTVGIYKFQGGVGGTSTGGIFSSLDKREKALVTALLLEVVHGLFLAAEEVHF